MEAISVDMKSLGRIAYETYCEVRKWDYGEIERPWNNRSSGMQDAWEAVADAVVEAHEQRKPDPEDDNPQQLI